MEGAIELDEEVRAAAKRGDNTPHDQFSRTRFRQPTLNEGKLKPAPYRKGKPMLPDDVQGPRPDEMFRRQTIGGGEGPPDLEAPLALTPPTPGATGRGVHSPFHTRTHAPSFIAPLTPPGPSVGTSARTDAEPGVEPSALSMQHSGNSMAYTEDDDDGEYDAEDVEKDVDVAVDALLQDEHSRKAVNAVSEGVGAIRRSTLIGPSAKMRNSSGELSSEDAVKMNTFANKDLEGGGESDRADLVSRRHPCPVRVFPYY